MGIDCVIGIDPGSNGAVFVWRHQKPIIVRNMLDAADLKVFLASVKATCTPIVFLEKLQLRHDDAQTPGKMFRIQELLANYERLKLTLEDLGIVYVLVHPMTWQSKLKLRIKGSGESLKDRKNRFKELAGKYYPTLKPTLKNADAALIATFGRWVLKNQPNWVAENIPKAAKQALRELQKK